MKHELSPCVASDPLGAVPAAVTDVRSLKRWSQIVPLHPSSSSVYTASADLRVHSRTPFPWLPDINHKVALWVGDLSALNADAIVHSTNEAMNERDSLTERIHNRAGPGLRLQISQEIHECKTGEVRVTQGHKLPARYIIHTVGPKYNVRYQTAAENTLYLSYRNVLQKVLEMNLRTIGLSVINSVKRNYPPDDGAHIALRTLRRFLEQHGSAIDVVVLCVDGADVGIYQLLLPLYFPRSEHEEEVATWQLPANLGGPNGEPVHPDRQIRIIDNPQHAALAGEESVELTSHLDVPVGEHAFSQMHGDLDQQRLLGERPSSDPLAEFIVKEMRSKERYERLLRRAKSEDLSEISGIGCLYQSGVDRFGRPVIVFVGKWFRFNEINLDKALLYLIYLLDPLVKNDYVIAYFHTLTSNANHPSFSWLKEVYNILPYKYKKNLKAFYIIHPTIWTKMMTWWFTTFMAPAIKQKVFNMAGVEYLYSTMSKQQLEIPAYITEYDMAINGLHYAPKTDTPTPT